jgi:hypothetical protein
MELGNQGDRGFPGPINLGNPRELTIRELAEKVLDITGSRSRLVFRPPLPFNRGIYESSTANTLSRGRVRTGAYAKSSFSPYVAERVPSTDDHVRKNLLFSFIGRASHPVRERIFALTPTREDVLIEDSSDFGFWGCADVAERERRVRYYHETLLRSRFALCPRGAGTGSIRLFESMLMGIAPVIIADGWIRPRGPAWDELAIFVRERHVADLERIVGERDADYRTMGELARQAYLTYFDEACYFDHMVENCLDMLRLQQIPEKYYWAARWLVRALIAPDSFKLWLDRPRYYLRRLAQSMRRTAE